MTIPTDPRAATPDLTPEQATAEILDFLGGPFVVNEAAYREGILDIVRRARPAPLTEAEAREALDAAERTYLLVNGWTHREQSPIDGGVWTRPERQSACITRDALRIQRNRDIARGAIPSEVRAGEPASATIELPTIAELRQVLAMDVSTLRGSETFMLRAQPLLRRVAEWSKRQSMFNYRSPPPFLPSEATDADVMAPHADDEAQDAALAKEHAARASAMQAPAPQPASPLTPGARVRTADPLTSCKAYPRDMQAIRRPGATGIIIPELDIEPVKWVRHDDSTEAPYDRDELTVIGPTTVPATLTREDAEERLLDLLGADHREKARPTVRHALDNAALLLKSGNPDTDVAAILSAFVAGSGATKDGGAK